MSQIEQVIKQIKSEFRVDSEGKVTVSIRGAARLADVDDGGLSKSLKSTADQNPRPLAVFLMTEGFDAADLDNWAVSGIPDTALALVLEYYGYETQERYRTEQAKACCRAFSSIGIRTWVQKSIGWEQPQPKTISPELEVAREVDEIYVKLSEKNPRIAQLLVDSRVNRFLGQVALPGTAEVWKGAVEFAEDLGYKTNHRNRGKLGKHVKAIVGHLGKEEKRLCNGTNQPIMLYPDNEEVRDAVTSFFEEQEEAS
jgi:hypothetical protein